MIFGFVKMDHQTNKHWHHWIYLALLIIFAIFLPTSKYMASLTQFLIAIHWVVRGDFNEKWNRIKKNYALWIFLSLYAIHLLGILYSKDLNYGWHDLKIKLPLLLFPIIFASSESLNAKEVRAVLLFFVAAVFAASLVALAGIFEIIDMGLHDFREASLFISHIRFALLVDLSLFILSFYFLRHKSKKAFKYAYAIGLLYFLVFLVASKAMTGIVVGLIVGILLSLRWIGQHSGRFSRWLAMAGVIILPMLLGFYLWGQIRSFYAVEEDWQNLEQLSELGNPYWHDSTNFTLENGHYVGIYLCEPELEAGWKEKSDYAYWGEDDRGHQLKYTLMRYLTSKGLRKDKQGVDQLDPLDVDLIEAGYANVRYRKKYSLNTRLYELIWQIDVYRKGGNPSGHSITQRIEFMKTAWAIILDHPFLGVGTGDVPAAFTQKYTQMETQLAPEWRLRSHNQWLSFGVALGIVGMLMCFLAIVIPGIINRRFSDYFFLLFFLVGFISMFNEDTLETQAGVALFAFFYSFFLFTVPDEKVLY